jgi:hypothetical protein
MSKDATTAGERRVLAEAPAGEVVDLDDLSDNQRVLSPDVIRRLCVGLEAKDVDPRGIRIKRARIVEPLDLSFCTVPHPLRFEMTTFDWMLLTEAQLPALWMEGCSLPGLEANSVRIDDLVLRFSEVSDGVWLIGARIAGQLDCSGATLTNQSGDALVANGAEINGGVFLRDGFSATGAVRLGGAKISQLDCSRATLTNEGGEALSVDAAEINRSVFLRDGFSALGAVRLPAVKIGGHLDCSRATLTNEGGDALYADVAEINGGVFLRDGFSATGAVRLRGARIGNQLDCSGATLTNEGGHALSADVAEINGAVFLRDGFSATGAVWLRGARIGDQLDCSGATLTNQSGDALVAEGVEINGGVFLRAGFSATGAVRLLGARIAGPLECSGATLTSEGRDALFADRVEIKDAVFFRGFSATGGVRLRGARIGGQLDCSGATLVDPGGIALVARDATISSELIFRNVRVTGGVDLFRASVTTLDDDLGQADHPLGSWLGIEPLVLDGFAYARFGQEAKWDSKLRQRWLKQTTDFQQGAWQQLIEVYRAQGRDDEVTRTSIAMHNDRVARAGLPQYRRWGRRILRAVVGHGYRPWLAGIWATAVIAAFALVVWKWAGMFVPEKQDVTGSPQPVAYAADAFLPIIDLGPANSWMPTHWVRWVEWSVILLGWALTTIFVAGFTRIVRSE